jgi:superfamily II DNA or RNA helicase
MKLATIIIQDEVNAKLINLDLDTRKNLVKKYKLYDPAARYTSAYKLGRWDGSVSFFGIGGTTYVSLLETVIEDLINSGYEITIEDRRDSLDLKFETIKEDYWGNKCWPVGHRFENQPIRLREDQVEAANRFLSNPQSIQELATGFGKCLAGNTLIEIEIDENSNFGRYLKRYVKNTSIKIKLKIAELATYLENYKQIRLIDNEEILISDLNIKVPTPRGLAVVNAFIKKENLPILTVSLSNGYTFRAAKKHLVQSNNADMYLENLKIGDKIDHRDSNSVTVTEIIESSPEDCFDIAIKSPHTYYDANGVVHHNTILTATLCHTCEKYGRTLIIVPNRSLVEQTYEDFNNVGLDTGVYFGTKKDLGRTHTICTWQSLNILSKKGKSLDEETEAGTIKEFLKDVNTVIVDETHVAQAQVLKSLLTNHLAHTPIRWGFTGTIPKDQISQWTIKASIGEIVGQVKAADLQEAGILSDCHINIMQTVEWKEFFKFPQELEYLVTDQERIKFISKYIKEISLKGNTLVLVDRIKCGKLLQEYLSELTNSEVPFVSGSVKTDDRKEEYQEIGQSDHGLLIATYGVAAVGINIVRLHNVVMIEPGKSFVRVIQSIGRGLRKGNDKDFVNIYDICATTKYSKKHLTERKRYYKEAKYSFSIDKVKRPAIG